MLLRALRFLVCLQNLWVDVSPATSAKPMVYRARQGRGAHFSGCFFRANFLCSRQDARNAKGMGSMTEDEIGKQVVDIAVRVHQERGPGLLETV